MRTLKDKCSDREISVLFYVDANETMGLGNLCRCRSLAIELMERSITKISVSCSSEGFVRELFKEITYRYIQRQDILDEGRFDVVIIDIPDCSMEVQQSLSKKCRFFVGIDDWGMGPYIYDVLIRPNILSLEKPSFLKSKAELWSGKEYIILHPEYARYNSICKKRVEQVLVCFGGSDPSGFTLRAVPILEKILPQEVTFNLVVGSAYSDQKKICDLIRDYGNIKVFKNLSNLAKLFSCCDTAVISGGTLLYEACAFGIPSVVLPQEQEQHEETKLFFSKNAVLRPERGRYATDEDISREVQKIYFDETIREKVSHNAKEVVSRDGTSRVIGKILNKLNM